MPGSGREEKLTKFQLVRLKELLHEVGRHQGGEPHAVEVDDEKALHGVEQPAAELHQLGEPLFEDPFFAVGAASVGRRVHDDAFVGPAPPHLTLHKLQSVLHDPADAVGVAGLRIGIGPGNDAFHSVHVGDVAARSSGGQGGPARIGEEVEHGSLVFPGADGIVDEIPVFRLLRKDADVPEGGEGELQAEVHVAVGVGDVPALGQFFEELPATAVRWFFARGVADEPGIGSLLPLPVGELSLPDGLGFGTDEPVGTEALEFFEIARIDQFVIMPVGGAEELHGAKVKHAD